MNSWYHKISEKTVLTKVAHVSKVLVTLFHIHVNSCWNLSIRMISISEEMFVM